MIPPLMYWAIIVNCILILQKCNNSGILATVLCKIFLSILCIISRH